MGKKLISILLAAVLCLGLVPSALASEEPVEEPVPAAAEPEAAPAEDGLAYYVKEAQNDQGETVQQAVFLQNWARAKEDYVSVKRGETTPLEVLVDDNRENVAYAWSYTANMEYGPRDNLADRAFDPIRGANAAVYPADEDGIYRCVVTSTARAGTEDPLVDDTVSVYFRVYMNEGGPGGYVEEQGEPFSLYPTDGEPLVIDDGQYGEYAADIKDVELGASVTLSVRAEIAPSVVPDSVKYQWTVGDSLYGESDPISGANGPTLTVNDVQKTAFYHLQATYEYEYRSPDGKYQGIRHGYAQAVYRVAVKSDLDLSLSYDREKHATYYEYESGGTLWVCVGAELGDPVALRAIVDTKGGDASGLVYDWCDSWSLDTQRNDEYTVKNVYGETWADFTCHDIGTNTERKIHVKVLVENGFSVTPEGAAPGAQEVNVPYTPRQKLTLRVNVAANDRSHLFYAWSCLYEGESFSRGFGGDGMNSEDEINEIVVVPTPGVTAYTCYVADGFGSEAMVTFHLSEPDPNDADGDGTVTVHDVTAFVGQGKLPEAASLLRNLVGM